MAAGAQALRRHARGSSRADARASAAWAAPSRSQACSRVRRRSSSRSIPSASSGGCARATCSTARDDLDAALALVLGAKEQGEAISVGLVANIADVMDALLERGITPDIVTDQTTTDPIRGYIPRGMTAARGDELRGARPRRADPPRRRHARSTTSARCSSSSGAAPRSSSTATACGRAPRCSASRTPSTWACSRSATSGRSSARASGRSAGSRSPATRRTSTRSTTSSSSTSRASRSRTGSSPRARPCSSRACRRASAGSGYGDRRKLGLLVNDAVASGRISGPIAFTRDHLDSGSVAAPCARRSACATAPTASPTGRS